MILWGLGAMGRLMARMVLADPDLKLVGAVSRRVSESRGAGTDIAEVAGLNRPTGIAASPTLAAAVEQAGGAQVVLQATSSFAAECAPELQACLEYDLDVVSIAEELAYPWAGNPKLADRLDEAAREAGHTILGTGVNPGFVLDTLIVVLTGVTGHVASVYARRVNDLSPFGPTVMRTQGVGLSVDQFREKVADGTVVGHIGFPESMHLIAKALGVRLTAIEQTREPIVSKVRRQTPHVVVEPGYVAGCRHTARGLVGGKVFIELEHPQQVRPEAEGVQTGDYIKIAGYPDIEIKTAPEIPGGIATAAIAVNMIKPVLEARPGLLTMLDLPIPRGSARRVAEVVADG